MNRSLKIVTVILFNVFCVSCNAGQENFDDSIEYKKNESQSGFISSLQLPRNTTITFFHEISGSDKLTKSIAVMSNQSFIDWIANFHLTLDNFDDSSRYLLGENVDKWNPKSPLMLEVAQVNFQNGMVLNIGYKLEDGDQVVVYLVLHGK